MRKQNRHKYENKKREGQNKNKAPNKSKQSYKNKAIKKLEEDHLGSAKNKWRGNMQNRQCHEIRIKPNKLTPLKIKAQVHCKATKP